MRPLSGPVLRCWGVPVDLPLFQEAVTEIITAAHNGQRRTVHLCNAYVLALAYRDPAYGQLLARGDLKLPDGMPLRWLARLHGIDRPDRRISGTELFLTVVDRGRDVGLRHFLYGSTPDVVDGLERSLRAEAPGVEIVGAEAPPFRPLTAHEEDDLADRIQDRGAQIVWVGLGTPRQDVFVDRMSRRLDAVLVPVGAAFDFVSGHKRRAPTWMQRLGLEWLHRLLREPRRLWRRYLLGNLTFLWGVAQGRTEVTRG